MKPTISIITSTYNAAATFPRLIESMRTMKTAAMQWIVVDGASTDSTAEIGLAASDVIDVFVTEPDSGIYEAWNKALAYASGEYVAFVGADDYLSADYCREALEAIDGKHNIICFKLERLGARKARIMNDSPWSRPRNFPLELGFHSLGTLHSRTLFEDQRFDERYKIAGDLEFLVRNWRSLRIKAHLTKNPLVYFGMEGVSTNPQSLATLYEERIALLKGADLPSRRHLPRVIMTLIAKRLYVRLGLTRIYCPTCPEISSNRTRLRSSMSPTQMLRRTQATR